MAGETISHIYIQLANKDLKWNQNSELRAKANEFYKIAKERVKMKAIFVFVSLMPFGDKGKIDDIQLNFY